MEAEKQNQLILICPILYIIINLYTQKGSLTLIYK